MEKDIKIWFLADTHFGYKGDDPDWLDDYAGYFENTVIPLMRKEAGENDILVHCGDVFDNRSIIGIETFTRVINLFEQFAGIFKDIRVVVGNHDMAKKSTTDATSVNVIKHIPNVKVYYKPEIDVIAGKKCLFNPWFEDLAKEKELLDSVDVDYIFGHVQIGGSKGADRDGTKVVINTGVKVSDFKKAQVYAGHIHIRQDNKNIHYLGNPYHKDRGDRGNKKGITVLDVNTGETRFIENTVSPRYVEESIYDILNQTVGELKKTWKNNRVFLHVKTSDMQTCTWDSFTDALGHCYRELEKVGDKSVLEMNTSSELKFGDAKSSKDYTNEFLDNQDLTPEFRRKVVEKMNDIMERI